MSETIICECIDGAVAIRDDGCFPVDKNMEQAASSYDDVWYVGFSDVTAAMLAVLEPSRIFREVLLCLASGEPGCPLYSYTDLLAMELVQKIDILQSVGGIARDWRTDIVPVIDKAIRMSEGRPISD